MSQQARDNEKVVFVSGKNYSKDELFTSLARELNFPDYFHWNWDSFEEIINDLSWIREKSVRLVHLDAPIAPGTKDFNVYVDILLTAIYGEGKLTSVTFCSE